MNLEPAAQSLREHLPGGRSTDLDTREKRIEKFGQIVFAGFGIVVVIGALALIYAILDKMVFSGEKPLMGVLALIAIVFGTLSLAYVLLREDLRDRRKKQIAPMHAVDAQLPAPSSRLIEEKPYEPVPTVIEDTTDLLPQKSTRKF